MNKLKLLILLLLLPFIVEGALTSKVKALRITGDMDGNGNSITNLADIVLQSGASMASLGTAYASSNMYEYADTALSNTLLAAMAAGDTGTSNAFISADTVASNALAAANAASSNALAAADAELAAMLATNTVAGIAATMENGSFLTNYVVGGDSLLTNYVGSGAGSADCNTVFIQVAVSNDYPYYLTSGGIEMLGSSSTWAINSGEENLYFVTTNNPTPPLSGWLTGLDGVEPAPELSIMYYFDYATTTSLDETNNVLVAADTSTSNAFVAADTVVSNAFVAADTSTSNAFVAADTVVSNTLVAALGIVDGVAVALTNAVDTTDGGLTIHAPAIRLNFNGTSSKISYATNAVYNIGTNDFELLATVNPTELGGASILDMTDAGGEDVDTGLSVEMQANGNVVADEPQVGDGAIGGGLLVAGSNNTVRVVKSSTNCTVYVNGVAGTTVDDWPADLGNTSTNDVVIGDGFAGTISNIVVKIGGTDRINSQLIDGSGTSVTNTGTGGDGTVTDPAWTGGRLTVSGELFAGTNQLADADGNIPVGRVSEGGDARYVLSTGGAVSNLTVTGTALYDNGGFSPLDTELATAGFVRGLLAAGDTWYATTNAYAAGLTSLSAEVPYTSTGSIALAVGYLEAGITTGTVTSIESPITFSYYLALNSANPNAYADIHPEICYTYEGTTNNLLGDWETSNQRVTGTALTEYSFTVAFNAPTLTNAVHIVGKLKCSAYNTATTLYVGRGSGHASHLNTPAAEVSLPDFDAALALKADATDRVPRITWNTEGGYYCDFEGLKLVRISDGELLVWICGQGNDAVTGNYNWRTNSISDTNCVVYVVTNATGTVDVRQPVVKPNTVSTTEFVGTSNVVASITVYPSGSNTAGVVSDMYEGNPDVVWEVAKSTESTTARNPISNLIVWEIVPCEWVNKQ